MSKTIKTLDGHVSSLVEARRATKDARFKPLPEGVERAADVAQGALAWLQQRLAADGFKSAPSQLKLTRRIGEITQSVGFQAMATNLSGASVQVVIHVTVQAASRQRWTAAEGTRHGSACLWSRQLGDLGGEHAYFQWELVDPARREAAQEDMLHKIRTLALPALDAWTSKAAIGEAVFRRTELDRADWLVETALWAGHHAVARRLLRELLASNPRLVPDYRVNLSRYQADPGAAEPFRGDPANGLAFLAARYGLEVD